MRRITISFLIAMAFVISVPASGNASVFLYAPRPDVRISFALDATELGSFQTLLLKFSVTERFISYRNVPRASGKMFFLGLRRDDSILIVAEKVSADAPMIIECSNINGGARDFLRVKANLIEALKQRWPHLVINGVE
jgi:hypothetical protein